MSDDYEKAIPVPGPESVPFWEGAKNHQLMTKNVYNVIIIGFRRHPSALVVVADMFEWVALSGRGTVLVL